ncbi:MAG: hypothetical protein IKB38_00155 [Clostridia bacterium]|nr:hypothetical protein [Clostridia bacterium]
MKKLISVLLIISSLTLCFVSCGNDTEQQQEETLTESTIKTELSNDDGSLDGTLTIDSGSPENVKAFSYVISDINASKLINKSYTRTAATTILNNPGKITYEQLKVCKAFNATMKIIGIFYNNVVVAGDYIEDILNIICDENTKTYEGWTISASVDQTADSITIKATHN